MSGATVGGVLHVALWVLVAGAAGCLALQLAGGHLGLLVTPAQALTPWVVPLAVVAAVAGLVAGRHAVAVAGAATGLAFLALVVPLVFPPGLPDTREGGGALTIAHSNLLFGNPSIGAAIDVLAATDADVIAVSELTPEFEAAIDASVIGREYPHRVTRPEAAARGLGVWSRVPLMTGTGAADGDMSLTVEVLLDGRPLLVTLSHPLPPLRFADHWRHETGVIAGRDPDDLARTVVVADLNVSYFHPPFRRFLERTDLTAVHAALGKGFGVSWPTDEPIPPFVRLDHALVGRDVTATSIVDVDVPGSDHRGFVVSVSWAAGR